MLSPEQVLWRAVLARAFLDAFNPGRAQKIIVPTHKEETNIPEREQAHKFLTAGYGAWAQSRHLIADAAGIVEEKISNAARKMNRLPKEWRNRGRRPAE